MALKIFYYLAGLASAINGIWMLVSADTWFHNLPGKVPDTGAFNGHLVRDLGLVYFLAGLAFLWSGKHLGKSRVLHIGLTIFFLGHAVTHVIDILLARLPASHWVDDIPLVFAPGIIMLLIALPAIWKRVNSDEN